jgi:hypothetical protein
MRFCSVRRPQRRTDGVQPWAARYSTRIPLGP